MNAVDDRSTAIRKIKAKQRGWDLASVCEVGHEFRSPCSEEKTTDGRPVLRAHPDHSIQMTVCKKHRSALWKRLKRLHTGPPKNRRPVLQYSLDGGTFIARHESMNAAAKAVPGSRRDGIGQCAAKNKRAAKKTKTSAGFVWLYEDSR